MKPAHKRAIQFKEQFCNDWSATLPNNVLELLDKIIEKAEKEDIFDVNISSIEGEATLLHHVVINHEMSSLISLLLSSGADINKANNNGDTPLHCLIKSLEPRKMDISTEQLLCLLENGASTTIKNNDKIEPLDLMETLEEERNEEFEENSLSFLTDELEKNYEIEKKAAILRALEFKQEVTRLWKSKSKADINHVLATILSHAKIEGVFDINHMQAGYSALHLAAFHAQTNVLSYLLRNGANVNLQSSIGLGDYDYRGYTALHYAIRSCSRYPLSDVKICIFLLKDYGTRLDIRSCSSVPIFQNTALELVECYPGLSRYVINELSTTEKNKITPYKNGFFAIKSLVDISMQVVKSELDVEKIGEDKILPQELYHMLTETGFSGIS